MNYFRGSDVGLTLSLLDMRPRISMSNSTSTIFARKRLASDLVLAARSKAKNTALISVMVIDVDAVMMTRVTQITNIWRAIIDRVAVAWVGHTMSMYQWLCCWRQRYSRHIRRNCRANDGQEQASASDHMTLSMVWRRITICSASFFSFCVMPGADARRTMIWMASSTVSVWALRIRLTASKPDCEDSPTSASDFSDKDLLPGFAIEWAWWLYDEADHRIVQLTRGYVGERVILAA